uniref:Endonuclease/exonuclease/phosphatase domain-containing protein n=1 Tax=Cyprinus carpio TaxID=7962 RepID=A0A8C1TQH4_CYPCA
MVYIYIDIEVQDMLWRFKLCCEIVIGCIYGPNNLNEICFVQVFSRLANLDCNNVILGGDFNCFLNTTMDKSPSVTFALQVSSLICDACYEQNLFGIWRFHNPTSKEFTFFFLTRMKLPLKLIVYLLYVIWLIWSVKQILVPLPSLIMPRSLSLYI